MDDGADPGDIRARVGEIGAPGADELDFQLRLAAQEQLLHLLGRLVLVVFAQVAIAAGGGDFIEGGGQAASGEVAQAVDVDAGGEQVFSTAPNISDVLARYFGSTPQFWLNLQTSHDLKIAERKTGSKIQREVQARLVA